MAEAHENISSLTGQCKSLESDISIIRKQLEQSEDAAAQYQSTIEDLEFKLKQKESTIEDLSSKSTVRQDPNTSAYQNSLHVVESQNKIIRDLKTEIKALESKDFDQKETIDNLNQTILRLRNQSSVLKSKKSFESFSKIATGADNTSDSNGDNNTNQQLIEAMNKQKQALAELNNKNAAQQRLVDFFNAEIQDLTSLIEQQWFLYNTSSDVSAANDSMSNSDSAFVISNRKLNLQAALKKNKERSKMLFQFTRSNLNDSISGNTSNRLVDSTSIPVSVKAFPEASSVYVMLAQLRELVGARITDVMEKSETMYHNFKSTLREERNKVALKESEKSKEEAKNLASSKNQLDTLKRITDEKLKMYEQEFKEMTKELNEWKTKCVAYKDHFYSVKSGYDKATYRIEKLNQELKEVKSQIRSRSSTQSRTTDDKILDKEVQFLNKKIETLESKLTETEAIADKYRSNRNEIHTALIEKEAEYERKLASIEHRNKNDYKQTLLATSNEYKKECAALKEEISKLKSELQKRNQELQSAIVNSRPSRQTSFTVQSGKTRKEKVELQNALTEAQVDAIIHDNMYSTRSEEKRTARENMLIMHMQIIIQHSKMLRSRANRALDFKRDLIFMKKYLSRKIELLEEERRTVFNVFTPCKGSVDALLLEKREKKKIDEITQLKLDIMRLSIENQDYLDRKMSQDYRKRHNEEQNTSKEDSFQRMWNKFSSSSSFRPSSSNRIYEVNDNGDILGNNDPEVELTLYNSRVKEISLKKQILHENLQRLCKHKIQTLAVCAMFINRLRSKIKSQHEFVRRDKEVKSLIRQLKQKDLL